MVPLMSRRQPARAAFLARGSGTTSTGRGARRSTRCVTLPKTARETPLLP
jgi:hypothetical protein